MSNLHVDSCIPATCLKNGRQIYAFDQDLPYFLLRATV